MEAMTEFEVIDRFCGRRAEAGAEKHGTVLGIGDDAALLSPTPGHQLAASVDMLVAVDGGGQQGLLDKLPPSARGVLEGSLD